MPDILHKVGFKSQSPDRAYSALTTIDGLAKWWTTETTGDSRPGGTIKFGFQGKGVCEVKVLEAEPGKRVLWQVVSGPEEWLGTKISFDISQQDDYTTVLFKHAGWQAPVEFMHHCSTKWAIFMMSLKSLMETGKGAPMPNDVRIDNWN
jgi:uncharacterized protein YndB with AHSA1/START domain